MVAETTPETVRSPDLFSLIYQSMSFILSILPILLIIYLMIGRRWSAARAGAFGYLSVLAISITYFGAGPIHLAYAHVKALVLAFDVLLIIWAAFFLYKVCDEAGVIRAIGQVLPQLTIDRGMQALLVGWLFASFLQGVGGFGVPVAVTAPILVSMGFNPLMAVVIPSLGHGWAVNFGSLGSSFQALINVSGIPAEVLAPSSAVFLGVICLVTGPMIAHAAAGWPAVRRSFLLTLFIGFVMAITQYYVAVNGLWNIAAFTASLVGFVILISFLLFQNRKSIPTQNSAFRALLNAFSGYLIVVLIILAVQFITPLNNVLKSVAFQIQFPETTTSLGFNVPASASREISPFGHTGMILIYASLLLFILYKTTGRYSPGVGRRIVNGTLQRVISSSVSILSMITMAVIMEYAGMTETVSRGFASGLITLYPIISPWIGALGAFMTGSNTNSNAIFGALQKQTAELLKFSIPIILAAQTTGGSLGSVAAPTKIVVGLSTLGLAGREGDVLRLLLGYVVFLVSLVSLLAVIGIILTQ